MAHDVFAYTRPLGVVLRRIDVVCLDPPVVLDRDAEAVEEFASCRDDRFQVRVGVGEVVVRGVGFVRVEIRKHVWNIDIVRTAERVRGVVGAHERYSGGFEFILALLSVHSDGRVVHPVERLYRPAFGIEVDFNAST